ncbi:MAG: magnesium transporter CorA family protein [Dehalococcoidia bacterium]
MRNFNSDQIVVTFEELIADNQMQTAAELLTSAEPPEQVALIEQASVASLARFVEALSGEERAEVAGRLGEEAFRQLTQTLAGAPTRDRVGVLQGGTGDVEPPVTGGVAAWEGTGGAGSVAPALAESPARRDFAIVDGRLVEASPREATVTIYAAPSAREQRALVEQFDVDEHTLASALDPDEISRMEFESARAAFIVWKRPRRGANETPELLEIASVGIFLRPDHLTVVSSDSAPLVRAGDRATSLQNLVLRLMSATVNEFLVELKSVKRTSQEISTNLTQSLDNRQLLRMFDLAEGLVYHINAIEGNGGVLRRLRAVAHRLEVGEEDIEFLDDIIIDNGQCIRQGQIFSTVLAGLMDARGNVINNNMNVLLKNLTMINVVFLPLGIIASMGGMSEFSVMLDEYAIDWRLGYLGFSAVMVASAWVLLKGMRAWTERTFGG